MISQIQEREYELVKTGVGSNTPLGKILVVDDEPELVRVLVESFQKYGFEATGCGSGHLALAQLHELDFDVLLTDLMMPEMDGITLLKSALKIDPHLVGIVVTGQGTIQSAVDAMQMGAFDYVLKPFRMQTLLPVLTRAMNVRRLKLENVQLRETVAIHSLAQTIAFTLDPQTVLSKLADAALQQSDADEVSILLPTIDGKELYVAAVRGAKRERLLGERVPLQQSISSWVARERIPLILNGEVQDERFVALWPRADIRSAISVPMHVAGKLVGIINLNVINRLRPFTLGEMKALTILASTAAAALESTSLYRQVERAEKNYRSIFENAVEGIFQSRLDGQFMTVNPEMARILGYESPEELITTVTDVASQLYVHPEARAEAARLQEELGVLHAFEFEAYRKNGDKIWLSLNRRSVRDGKGVELYREGSIEDITDSKRAEAERLVMFEIIQGSITTRNLEDFLELIHQSIGKLLYAENCFVGLYHETTGLMQFEYWADQFDPVPSPHSPGKGFSSYVLRTNKPLLLTEELKAQMCGSGEAEMLGCSSASWLGVPLRMASRAIGVLVVQHYEKQDVYTQHDLEFLSSVADQIALAIERKRAEEALQESEERYRHLFEGNPLPMWVYDLETLAFLEINDAAIYHYGYSREEFLSMTIMDIRPPEEASALLENISRVSNGLDSAGIWQHRKKDGTIIDVEITSHALIFAGRAELVLANDVTERRRTEEMRMRRTSQVALRADVSAALAESNITLRRTLERCTEAMVQHLGAAFARIWTLNKEDDVLELQASAGLYTHIDGPHARVPVGAFKIGLIAQEREPHITNNVQDDPRVGDKEWASREGMIAFAGYPLIVEDRLVGVMAMFARQNLADDTLDALASVADIISQGIERKRAEDALRDSESRKRAILESAMDCVITMDHEGLVAEWNPAAEKAFGYSYGEVVGKEMAELIIPLRYREHHRQGLARYLATGKDRVLGKRLELSANRSDGTEFPVELTITRIELEGNPMFTGYLRDITDRKEAESRLAAQYAVTRTLAESNTISEAASKILQAICENLGWEYGALWTVDRSSNVLRCSEVWQAQGKEADEFETDSRQSVFTPGSGLPGRVWSGGQPAWIADISKDTNFPRAAIAASLGLRGGCAFPIRVRSEILGVVEFFSHLIREPDPNLLGMMVTIGSQVGQFIERKRVDEALSTSEEQLRQSQKLEAIGQLAGGVAHDFNNLLTVIGGYSSILLNKLDQESPFRLSVEEIKKASDRAGGLTRQLLAFSRKQILQPKVLDLNVVVSDLDKMVRRLIGEDVDLLTITDPGLGKVKADPGQIEQVLLNLIVNGRDAMPDGGKLTIETANATLSDDYALSHAAVAGPYVMLAVSDTGCGMPAELQKHVFEPFFTTKIPGKGTGLGLATVYGIVKQSDGHIWLYSEPGKGTCFKIYLPCVDEVVAAQGTGAGMPLIPKGTETLLLVEDEDQVRRIVRAILEQQGYDVLAAANGEEALTLAKLHGSNIHMLMTDVVMPQMSGRQLAEKLTSISPQLKVLYMSGYTDDAIVRHGLLEASLSFIQKPFDAATAARKVREVLDSQV